MPNHYGDNNHFVISNVTDNTIIAHSIAPVSSQVSRQSFTCISGIFKQHNSPKIFGDPLRLGLIQPRQLLLGGIGQFNFPSQDHAPRHPVRTGVLRPYELSP